MKKLIFIAIIVCTVLSGWAQQKPAAVEELVYSGYYNWGIFWMRAGTVKFTVSPSEKYPGAVELQAIGTSLPSWDWVFKLRDTLTSHFNPDNFLPYEFSRKAHEGSYHKTFDYTVDYDSMRVYGETHKIGKYFRKDTIPLQPLTYDMLSVAWMAREINFDTLSPKELIPIRILIDNKIYDLYIRYQGLDKVRVGGKKRECYVFSPLLVEGDVFKGGENMKIWVSKDEHRIPLMVEAKILVGSVKGILEPADSKY